MPKKPDPAVALDLARQLDLSSGDFVLLGDTAIDMQTAAAAGMLPAGALWGFRDEQELHAAGARVLIRHPGELIGAVIPTSREATSARR